MFRLISRNIVNKEININNTAVQNNRLVSFRIFYTSMEAISQKGHRCVRKFTKDNSKKYQKYTKTEGH